MRLSSFALTLIFALAAAAAPAPPKLTIVRAVLHEGREDGPVLRANYEYVPGELLYLSFRATGYTVKNDAVDLRWQTYITDPAGTMISEMEHGAVKDDISGNDKDWMPLIQESIALAPQLPGGEYTVHLRVADENAQSSAEQTLTFKVRGRPLEKVDTLTLRKLRFYRTEDDTQPLDPVVYAPGATLWLRCELVGFELRKDNGYDVAYGYSIYREPDKLMFTQPDAGADRAATFYPKRWLTAIFSVTLSPNLAEGNYRIVVKATDALAGKTAEQGAVFAVKK